MTHAIIRVTTVLAEVICRCAQDLQNMLRLIVLHYPVMHQDRSFLVHKLLFAFIPFYVCIGKGAHDARQFRFYTRAAVDCVFLHLNLRFICHKSGSLTSICLCKIDSSESHAGQRMSN